MAFRILLAAAAFLLAGCQSVPLPPLARAAHVDLGRFMGDWYVIANIPTPGRGAHNAVESYRLEDDGTLTRRSPSAPAVSTAN